MLATHQARERGPRTEVPRRDQARRVTRPSGSGIDDAEIGPRSRGLGDLSHP